MTDNLRSQRTLERSLLEDTSTLVLAKATVCVRLGHSVPCKENMPNTVLVRSPEADWTGGEGRYNTSKSTGLPRNVRVLAAFSPTWNPQKAWHCVQSHWFSTSVMNSPSLKLAILAFPRLFCLASVLYAVLYLLFLTDFGAWTGKSSFSLDGWISST